MQKLKALIKSRTFWWNALKFASGVVMLYTTDFPSSHYVGAALMLESIISFVLRLNTSSAITTLVSTPTP